VVQIPTTLLAQVDSSVGGKTGVNLKAGKNLLGTFHQPLAVLADPDVLKTLPEREYRSGLFEAMKYGVIRNPAIFEMMESNSNALLRRDGAPLETLITECIRVKAEVVSADERESGERRILNFGHTIGHALEAETNYRRLLHGEAVGWGMIAAAMIAASMQITDTRTAQRILSLVLAYGPLPKLPVDSRSVMKRLAASRILFCPPPSARSRWSTTYPRAPPSRRSKRSSICRKCSASFVVTVAQSSPVMKSFNRYASSQMKVPQGLKPRPESIHCGAAEAVPLQNRLHEICFHA
jgi:hypothetical protein